MLTPKNTRNKRPPTPRYPSKVRNPDIPNLETIHTDDTVLQVTPIDIVVKIERPRLVLPKEKFVRIALCGKLCSGKTTLAQHIQHFFKTKNDIDIQRIAFGDYTKTIATEYFQMQDNNHVLLTKIATTMRNINEDVWANCVRKHITQSSQQHWVVDDLRYENEYNMLKELRFRIIRLDISREEQLNRIHTLYKDTREERCQVNAHSPEKEIINKEHFYFDEVISPVDTTGRVQHWLEKHYNVSKD